MPPARVAPVTRVSEKRMPLTLEMDASVSLTQHDPSLQASRDAALYPTRPEMNLPLPGPLRPSSLPPLTECAQHGEYGRRPVRRARRLGTPQGRLRLGLRRRSARRGGGDKAKLKGYCGTRSSACDALCLARAPCGLNAWGRLPLPRANLEVVVPCCTSRLACLKLAQFWFLFLCLLCLLCRSTDGAHARPEALRAIYKESPCGGTGSTWR